MAQPTSAGGDAFTPAAPPPAAPPRPVSLRVQRFQKLRELLSPEAGLERVESYSKWVFAGTAAITALGALYTKELVGELNASGRVAAGLGIFILAFAMAAASRALAPVMVEYNPNSLDDMSRAVDAQFTARKPWVEKASRRLAAALVLFGLAPLVGSAETALPRKKTPPPRNQVAVSYGVSAKPALDAKLQVAGAAPFRVAELRVDRTDSAAVVAQTAVITDAAGSAAVTLKTDSLGAGVYALQARYVPALSDSLRPDTPYVALHKSITISRGTTAARRANPQQRARP